LLNKEGKISIHFSSEESKRKEKTIIINHQFLEKKMGQKIAVEVFENLLKRLNFSFKKKVNSHLVKIPFHRSDIIKVEDLYEEIMRIYDYNKIDSHLPI
jgi:phenylalanyl-tRNA synthetase beta chain